MSTRNKPVTVDRDAALIQEKGESDADFEHRKKEHEYQRWENASEEERKSYPLNSMYPDGAGPEDPNLARRN